MSYVKSETFFKLDSMKESHAQKKIRRVHIHSWLYKYMLTVANFTVSGDMIVRGTILIPTDAHKHKETSQLYFMPAPGKVELSILTRQSDINKIYQLIRYYKHRFYQDMISYTAARHNILPAKTALREFLNKKEIYESEYSMEAAYKKWQRSDEYRELQGSSIFSGQGKLSLEKYNKVRPLLKKQHELNEKIQNELNQQQLYG